MGKTSTFFPKYQLGHLCARSAHSCCFRHLGMHFVTKCPAFGMTETQKSALQWAHHVTPPVVCISHEAPSAPDRQFIKDPNRANRVFKPYAMALATIECLGEPTPRQIKVYFCHIDLHESNQLRDTLTSLQGVYITPIPSQS